MRWLAAWGVLLLGCYAMPDPTYGLNAQDRVQVAFLMAEWARRGLEPITDECHEDLLYMGIAVVGNREFQSACTKCAPSMCLEGRPSTECPDGCAYACYTKQAYGVGSALGRGRRIPILTIHEDTDLRGGIHHEARHWLEDCTGRGVSPNHSGPVWDDSWTR